MPKLKIGGSSELAPEGEHTATLTDVQLVPNSFYKQDVDSPDKAMQLEWIFELVDNPNIRLHAWSTIKLSIHKGIPSKALRIVEALAGRKLQGKEREEFSDTDTLLGKRCVVEVEHIMNRNGEARAKIVDFQRDDSPEEDTPSKSVPF